MPKFRKAQKKSDSSRNGDAVENVESFASEHQAKVPLRILPGLVILVDPVNNTPEYAEQYRANYKNRRL